MHKSDNFRAKLPQPRLVRLSSRLALCSCTVISLPPACPGTSYLCHPILIQSRLCSAQYMWWVPCKWAAAQHLLFFYLQSSLCGPKPCLQVAFLLLLCVQNRSLPPNPLWSVHLYACTTQPWVHFCVSSWDEVPRGRLLSLFYTVFSERGQSWNKSGVTFKFSFKFVVFEMFSTLSYAAKACCIIEGLLCLFPAILKWIQGKYKIQWNLLVCLPYVQFKISNDDK